MYPQDIPTLINFITKEAKDNPGKCPAICIDSRKVQRGDIFIALPGTGGTRAGAEFIEDAISKGSSYIICQPKTLASIRTEPEITYVTVMNPREVLAFLARAYYGTRVLSFPVIGITGTNGKTTISYILEHIYKHLGKRTGIIGTIAYTWPDHYENAPLTTPDCLSMHNMLRSMRKANVEAAFVEASSHALAQARLEGIDFMGAIFTNLTQDHLDYHASMQEYFDAKARLFTELTYLKKTIAINTDDLWGQKLYALLRENKILPLAFGFGERPLHTNTFLQGEILKQSIQGLHLRMTYFQQTWEIRSPLIGRFNAENLLAAQALCLGFKFEPETFTCLESFTGLSGRLERINNPQNLPIFVDYAHTPDALENVLTTLRDAGFARIITVFGCGGNRDASKRPLMGKAVATHSDIVIVTSDNPRHEDPQAIIDDIMPGLAESRQTITEPNRRNAIKKAIDLMTPQDVLLIAGKGHEQTQQTGDIKHPFSDQRTVREILGCE